MHGNLADVRPLQLRSNWTDICLKFVFLRYEDQIQGITNLQVSVVLNCILTFLNKLET